MMYLDDLASYEDSIIIESIRKEMTSDSQEIDFKVLKASHKYIIDFLDKTVKSGKDKSNFHMIGVFLNVFAIVEEKLIAYAATDIASVIQQELLSTISRAPKYALRADILANVINDYARKWKSYERLFMSGEGQIGEAKERFEDFNLEKIVKILLDTFLLKENFLFSEAINQLKRIVSFESHLYRELNKMVFINNTETLSKCS